MLMRLVVKMFKALFRTPGESLRVNVKAVLFYVSHSVSSSLKTGLAVPAIEVSIMPLFGKRRPGYLLLIFEIPLSMFNLKL